MDIDFKKAFSAQRDACAKDLDSWYGFFHRGESDLYALGRFHEALRWMDTIYLTMYLDEKL